jgi:hypothetical protein
MDPWTMFLMGVVVGGVLFMKLFPPSGGGGQVLRVLSA